MPPITTTQIHHMEWEAAGGESTIGGVGPTQLIAQTFTVVQGFSLQRVRLKLANTSSASVTLGSVQLSIRNAPGGVPAGSSQRSDFPSTDDMVVVEVAGNAIPIVPLGALGVMWVVFRLGTPVFLNPGTTYALVIKEISSGLPGAIGLDINGDTNPGGYAGGTVYQTTGGTGKNWIQLGGECLFDIIGTRRPQDLVASNPIVYGTPRGVPIGIRSGGTRMLRSSRGAVRVGVFGDP